MKPDLPARPLRRLLLAAMSPPLAGYDGRQLVGCRACWMEPRLVINYTAH